MHSIINYPLSYLMLIHHCMESFIGSLLFCVDWFLGPSLGLGFEMGEFVAVEGLESC